MADGSSRVVYAALAGNFLVAVSKYVAALSGSSAMLTEAIHSTSDCTNQLLLLIGVRRGKLPADDPHRFGYGMEIYFWNVRRRSARLARRRRLLDLPGSV